MEELNKKERIKLKNLERESIKVIVFEANGEGRGKRVLGSGKSEEKLEIFDQFL
jgi:hypothetical protein